MQQVRHLLLHSVKVTFTTITIHSQRVYALPYIRKRLSVLMQCTFVCPPHIVYERIGNGIKSEAFEVQDVLKGTARERASQVSIQLS